MGGEEEDKVDRLLKHDDVIETDIARHSQIQNKSVIAECR